MNAILNIQVRVMSAQALAQLKGLQTQLKQTQAAGAGAGAGLNRGFGAGISGALQKSTAFGKNLQWTGRQLEFNFTLPILLAGVAAAKWSNDVEKATTKVRKVYGDLNMSQDDVNANVDHLAKSFEALSNIFGVHQAEVGNIAAMWAAAGAQGVALANATRKTMEVMILGEMDQEEAVRSLLTIQQAYGFSIEELGHKLDMLNTVENQTAISFAGLIDVVTRAGGAARTAGVDIEHLAAMAASLVPATGTASTAGNALRTILTRLLVPTKQAADVMAKMGIDTSAASWQMKNGVERIEAMAKAFDGLTKGQQATVSKFVASQFQVNRFDVLMRAIIDPMSAYNRMLKETGNEQRNHATYLRELNTVLQSSPQAWKILTTQLQNALIKIIIPMMPAFLALASHVVKLADSFSKLNPNTQRWIMLGLIALALFGPFIRYLGAFITLGSLLLRFFEFGAIGLSRLAAAFGYTGAAASAAAAEVEGSAIAISAGWLAAIPLIIASLAVAFVLIRQHWRSILDWIVTTWNRAWNALPSSVQNAFRRVVAIIASAAQSVADWLSHMNPFARHSPSLVDQVTKGTTVISDQYAGVSEAPDTVNRMSEAHRTLQSTTKQISSTGSSFATVSTGSASATAYQMMQTALDKLTKAYAADQAAASRWSNVLANAKKITDQFTAATTAGVQALQDAQMRKDVEDILPFAPNAAQFIDDIIAAEHALKAAMAEVTIEIDRQQAIVDTWKRNLDAANNALDTAQAELDRLKDVASAVNDDLQNAQQTLDDLSNTPIAGMRAMSDAIFANDMAVKQLQLTILNADRIGQGLNEQISKNSIAQKRLQLEMLRMQNQVGMSAEEAQSKLAALQGNIEMLNASASDLRLAGAGSDVLGPIEDQVQALEHQRQEVQAAAQPLQNLQDQLDALQNQGQILDLERELNLAPLNHQLEILQQQSQALDLQNSLKFDPLTRELDQLINTMDEMPFDQIKQKIIEQKQVVDQLQGAYDQANVAVTSQQAVVDQLKASRDAINLTYDTETAKLGILKDSYSELNDQLQDLASSWSDVSSGAKNASSAADQFDAAGQGDFEDVGGAGGGFGDAGSLADIDALTAKWQKEIDSAFGNFDMFKPLKDAWNKAWEWTKKNVGGAGGVMAVVGAIIGGFVAGPIGVAIGAGIGAGLGKPIMNGLKDAFGWATDNLDTGGVGSKIGDSLGSVFDSISSFGGRLKQVGDMFGTVFDSIGRPLAVFGGMVSTFFTDFTDMLGEQFKKWGPLLEPAIEAIGHVVNVIRMVLRPLLDVFKIMLVGILAVWEFVWPILLNVIKPIFDTIVAVTKGWLEVIRGIITFVLAIINGEWGKAWEGLKTILAGVWDGIYGVVKGVFGLIYGVIKGVIQGIIGFFKFLYNTLIGHSIIPDLINGIIFFFNLLLTPIRLVFDGIMLILGAFKWFIENVLAPVFGWLWHSIIEPVFHGIAGFIALEIDGLKVIFNVIKAFIEKVLAPVFTWLWHTIVEPVFNGIKAGISLAWDGIKGTFNAIKGFIENVLAPVFGWLWHNIIEPIWNGIQEATSRIWSGIQAVMRGAVNGVIKIINALINGINAIADHIPGINIHINTIKELGDNSSGPGDSSGAQKVHMVAKGGVFVPGFGMVPAMGVGSGFSTNRPTAIVGEGSKTYPEYIIPTDPQHRGRALALVDSLYRRFGGVSLPSHGIGFPNPLDIGRDIIGGAGGVISDVGGWLRTNGAKAIVAPFFATADKLIGALPDSWMKEAIVGLKNNLYDWITGTDNEIASAVSTSNSVTAGQTTQKVHVMDRGGVLPPGLSAVFNGTGANEVLTPRSNDARENHFYGDLVFPNIKSGDDAEEFIKNLEALV